MIRLGKRINHTFLLMLLLTVSSTFADDSKWQVEIELSKTTYLEHEPIWLDVYLTNISSDTLRCWGLFPPCQGPFSIEVIDSKGTVLRYTGNMFDLVWGDGIIIASKEKYYGCYDLIDLFGSGWIGGKFGLIPVGEYSVRGKYENASLTDELKFEIVEPSGQEKQVRQLVIEAHELDRHDRVAAKKNYQKLIGRYSESVYNESISFRFITRSEFLKRFPNSGYTEFSLSDATSQLSYEEKQEYLNSVIVEYPETRAAKFAEQMLKLMEKESTKSGKGE